MALLDNLFSKKASREKAVADAADSRPGEGQAAKATVERKVLRLERRELLYAVIRESMARVGILSSSYKYKVLSLDSRGNEYLVMMDLPQDLASHLDQLASIEETVVEAARQRHQITVVAVYWRIQDLGRAGSGTLRRPRPQAAVAEVMAVSDDSLPLGTALQHRFEPIRPDEVRAYKGSQGRPPAPPRSPAPAPVSENAFEETRIEDPDAPQGRMPLSRTQYGDLI
jgi:hypothetical protein